MITLSRRYSISTVMTNLDERMPCISELQLAGLVRAKIVEEHLVN